MSTNINIPLFEFPPSLEPEPPHFPSPHPAHLHQQPQEHYLPSGALLVSSRRASVGAVASARPHPLPARRLSQIATEMFAHPSAMARPPHTSPLTRLHARPNPPALSLFRHVSPSGAPPSFASAPLSQPASLATANEPRTPHELAHAHYPPVYVQDHVHRSSSPTLRQAQDWPSPSVQQPSLDSYNYAPSTPAARADIKHEDPSTDETMLWLHDHSQAEYPLTAEVEYVFEDPIAMAECKQEAYAQDWNEIPAYENTGLFVDTSGAAYHDGMLHQDFEDGMYVDSPQSSSFPELHPVPPRLQTSSRSYTLEGAITPITPNPRVDNCGTLANPNGPHRSSSPPMGSLVAPSSRSPPAESSPMPIKAEPSPPPPSAPTPPPPVVQKRPRGRPRKNPPNARPSSPPPAVDYPFPQFPEPSSSSASSALRAEDAALPPMAHPVPTLTAGTPGASGPGAGKGAGAGASAMPGQAMFRLNMHREGSGEGADAPQPEKKKQPIMACLFCRERKIACGPPAPGGPRRCNQCTRRDLVCEYPKESRRGQHKRGTRAQRVEALASGAALPSTIKPKGKGRADVHVDTENLPDAGSGPSQPSPLTPLSPPPTERPSRSEKVVRAQEHDGKERSRSRAPARDGWDAPHAAARRAVHQQHKRRTVGQGPGPGLGPGSGMGGLSPSGDVGPPSSSAMARIVHGSELAMAGVHITRGMPGM